MANNTSEIKIIDEENRVLIQFSSQEGAWDDISAPNSGHDISSENVSLLNHWISSIPTGLSTMAGNSSQLMTCTFNYNQLIQAKDGSGAIGAVFKDGTNKIGAQGRFHEASNLKSLVNLNMAFNFASQIVAQKHLADINERLRTIEHKIDEIKGFLETSRLAKILALHEHIDIIGRMIVNKHEVSAGTLQNLSKSALEVRADVIHLKKEIDLSHTTIEQFDSSSLFGSNDLREKLRIAIDNIDRLQSEYLLGMQCLLIANLILFIKTSGSEEFLITNEVYLKELNLPGGSINKWEKTKRTVSLHLSKMKPLFERTASSEANAALVERKIKKTDDQYNENILKIIQLNSQLQAAKTPSLMVEVADGKVLRAKHLD
ncbi:hypothetical protein SD961_01525 [Erwinia sp. MMLR14_017]|uniref:hypothetical protein n=1 Tax=Erwinia sp. MMLR14_017 TaxID=3093842 RepID=UPI0029906F0D|nr:hypothetical protein [Erwinia sp. MMLR14_017]MDW8844581.1 hypothetical protein [Erwinia sp. MMLR14_017]